MTLKIRQGYGASIVVRKRESRLQGEGAQLKWTKIKIEILERIYQNSRANSEEVFTRLFRYMLRPDIYFLAYKNLYANQGASTPGVDEINTADGFSEAKEWKLWTSTCTPCRDSQEKR